MLTVFEDTDYRTLFGVGAAYVKHPAGDELLVLSGARRQLARYSAAGQLGVPSHVG